MPERLPIFHSFNLSAIFRATGLATYVNFSHPFNKPMAPQQSPGLVVRVAAWAVCLAVLGYGDRLLDSLHLLTLQGSPQQQYWAHLGLFPAWAVLWLALLLPLFVSVNNRITRPWIGATIGATVAAVVLLQLVVWFPRWNQVTVRLAKGVYETRHGEQRVISLTDDWLD